MPTNTPVPVNAVLSLTLINAVTNQPVPGYNAIPNGATIDLEALGLTAISMRANTNPSSVGSVIFTVDGSKFQTENILPYAMAGDTNGNFNPWNYTLGNHTVSAAPYTGSNGSGTAGQALTISFTLLRSVPTATATAVPPTPTNTPVPPTATPVPPTPTNTPVPPTATPPSGELPWLENFSGLPTGASSDNGPTAWSATRSSNNGGVYNGRFEVENNGGELVWTSEAIPSGTTGLFSISVDVEGTGPMETSGPNIDTLRLSYRLNGGAEVPFFAAAGNVAAQTAAVSGLQGSTVQIVIRAVTTSSAEIYAWDNVHVQTGTVETAVLFREAEEGARSGAFVVANASAASGGKYVHVPNGFGSRFSVDEGQRVDYAFTVTTPGTYRINAQVYAANGNDDSFHVRVDGASTTYLWDTAIGSNYHPDYVNDRNGADPVEVFLGAGAHTISIYLREDGTRLDSITLELAP